MNRQLLERADAVLDNLFEALKPIQRDYIMQYGRYWQGIRTPKDPPVNGEEKTPARNKRPTYQAETWAGASVPTPSTTPLSLSVHTYIGPLGPGYFVEGVLVENGKLWRRTINFGPETHFEHNWISGPVNAEGVR